MTIRLLRGPAMRVAVGLALAVVSLTASAATNVWTGTVNTNWFEPGNWSLSVVPTNEADVSIPVVVAAKTPLLTNATANLASFVLASNQVLNVSGWTSAIIAREMTIRGIIRHASNTVVTTNSAGEWVPDSRIWLQGSNITILAGAQLFGDYRGYPTNSGPGRPGNAQGGAGHAGEGGRTTSGLGGPAYGDPAAPEQPGSGGGYNANSRSGGGAIRVEAEGQLTILGTLTAKGQNGAATHGAGGSGGSVWLTCHTLQGTAAGLIAVDGGGGDRDGGGGAGGRIAVDVNSAAQAALPEPVPLIRFSGKAGYMGSSSTPMGPLMGSLYFADTNLLGDTFTAKRFQSVKLVIPGFTNWAPAALTLDDCILGLPDGIRVQVAGNLVLTNSGGLHLFAASVTNPVTDDGAYVGVGGNCIAATGCWFTLWAEPTNGAIVRIAVTGNLEVAWNGGFDADYRGYKYGWGPGAPDATTIYAPGGYGGQGEVGYGGQRGGSAYGSAAGPIQAGSGGSPAVRAGNGGGAIRLEIGGRAVIDGTLTARGQTGIYNHGPAGSGGGISLSCRTFEGTTNGLLRVDGGQGNYHGGSGGGGRIAIAYDSAAQAALADPRPPVRFSAYVFPKPTQVNNFPYKAEMGTLYFPDTRMLAASPASPAVLDGQRFWHVRLAIPDFTNWAPASLTVSNCVIRFPEGFHLSVAGDLALQEGGVNRLAGATNTALHLYPAATNGTETYGARLDVGGNLLLQTNAWLVVKSHPTNAAVVGVRVAGDATLDAGGGLDADGGGYYPVSGNTNGPGAGRNTTSGGGYGGQGGGAAGGYTNGLAELPDGPGSPGGWYAYGLYTPAAPGGGALRLLCGGTLTLNGTLTANGYGGVYTGGAGGSGGGILVSALRFKGTGLARANGGNGHSPSGTGGGGRIAVWYNLPLQTAERLIAQRSSKFLTYQSTHPDFSGTMVVETGTIGTAGTVGTKGFYRYAVTGTLMLVR